MKKFLAALTAAATLLTFVFIPASAHTKPTAPKLSSAINTEDGIKLSWKAVKNAFGYYVYRKTASTSFKKIATVSKTSVTIKSAVSGKKYTYKIAAYNKAGKSKASNPKTLTRVATPLLVLKNTSNAIKASWSAVKGATQYVLLAKKASEKNYTELYRGKSFVYKYDNFNLGTSYSFKIKAIAGKTRGASSRARSFMFLESPSLIAEELNDMKGITLKWSKISGADGYIILRSIKREGDFKRIAKISAKSATYVDDTVTGIESYNYYVIAYKGSCKSAKSNIDGDVFGRFEGDDVPLTLTLYNGEVYSDLSDKLIRVAGTITLKTYFTWKIADPSVLSINELGVVTALKKGKTRITVHIDPIEGITNSQHNVLIDVTVK